MGPRHCPIVVCLLLLLLHSLPAGGGSVPVCLLSTIKDSGGKYDADGQLVWPMRFEIAAPSVASLLAWRCYEQPSCLRAGCEPRSVPEQNKKPCGNCDGWAVTLELMVMMFSDEAAACVDLQSSWRRSQQSFDKQSVLSNRLLTAIATQPFQKK